MQTLALFQRSFLASIPCVLLIMLALYIQSHILFHADNAYFIHAAQLLLSGETYLHGFFETNPPLVIILDLPVAIAMRLAAINSMGIFRLYIALMGLISIGLSYFLLRRIIANTKLLYAMMYVITIVIFFLPTVNFGQREHILVMFALPYLCLAMLRCDDQSVPLHLAVLTGMFAGIGFCLKPYFFTLPVMIEAYLIVQKRNLLAAFRAESLSVLVILFSYLSIVLLFFPDYVYVVVPLLKKYYLRDDWSILTLDWLSIYVFVVLISSFIINKKNPYPHVINMLRLAVIAFLFTYLLSGRVVFYHELPMFSFAVILGFLGVWQIFQDEIFQQVSSARLSAQILWWLFVLMMMFVITSVKDISSATIYLVAIRVLLAFSGIVAIMLAYRKSQHIFQKELPCFFVSLSLVLSFFLSAIPFGQWEQMLFVFAVPYFFDLVERLQNPQKITTHAKLVGLMLGVAMMIDFHFCFVVTVLESWLIWRDKQILWRSRQGIAIAIVMVMLYSSGVFSAILHGLGIHTKMIKDVYVCSLLAKHPKNEAQFEMMNYYYSCFIAVLCAWYYQQTRYRVVVQVLWLSLLGFILLSLVARTAQSHFATVPMLGVTNMLAAFIVAEIALTKPTLVAMTPLFIQIKKAIVGIMVSFALFFYPVLVTSVNLVAEIYDKTSQVSKPIVTYLNHQSHVTFDMIATDDIASMLLDEYSKARFVGQFPMYWWVPSMQHAISYPSKALSKEAALRDQAFFVNLIAQSISSNKPQLMIVMLQDNLSCTFGVSPSPQKGSTIQDMVDGFTCQSARDPNSNYLITLLKYPIFQAEWQHYHHVASLDNFEIYQRS